MYGKFDAGRLGDPSKLGDAVAKIGEGVNKGTRSGTMNWLKASVENKAAAENASAAADEREKRRAEDLAHTEAKAKVKSSVQLSAAQQRADIGVAAHGARTAASTAARVTALRESGRQSRNLVRAKAKADVAREGARATTAVASSTGKVAALKAQTGLQREKNKGIAAKNEGIKLRAANRPKPKPVSPSQAMAAAPKPPRAAKPAAPKV